MKQVPVDLFAQSLPRAAAGAGPETALTVSDLTLRTRNVVETRMQPLWVRGEITDFTPHRNGHWYFCLRDKLSKIRCVVWAGDQYHIPAPPDDGMQVVLFGQMTVYTARGDLQLKVSRIDAEGDGLWRKAMEVTLERLRRDGLLEQSRKRPIPRYPRRIAVVTSPDGAALHDIVTVIRKRNSGAELIVCAAKVQGDGAVAEIVRALRSISLWGRADVIILGRGGGGKEDLWAFNDERVARAICACPVPVITAVGHEVDMHVCDAVADLRAPTPSAAASLACVAGEEKQRALALAARDISNAIQSRIAAERNELNRLSRCIGTEARRGVTSARAELSAAAGRLNALSPLATLSRGYAVARDREGNALTSARQFTTDKEFEVLLHDGTVGAKVTSVTVEPKA